MTYSAQIILDILAESHYNIIYTFTEISLIKNGIVA